MSSYKLKQPLPGYKVGEEFHLSNKGNLIHAASGELVYTKRGLRRKPEILKDWFEEILEEPKTVWDLGIGDAYYIPCWDDQVGFDTWLDRPKDLVRRTLGNCFLTKEEAEKELARRKAKVILRRDTKGFEPDWRDTEQYKYYVSYYVCADRLEACLTNCYRNSYLYFATREDAEASIKAHPEEWKTYLGVEE